MPLTVLAPRALPPRCPVCRLPLTAEPLRTLPGTVGGVVVPIRCARRSCRALVEVVCQAAPRHCAQLHAPTG